MPQYKLETSYNLVPAFEGMGAKKAFMQGEADCSGMGWKKGDLWISQIRHKAYLELNEEGSEAAAATAVEMATRSAMPSRIPRRIQIDHPFLFLIRHNATGVILFMGRVMNPANPK